jgi:hypothetical protein
MPATIAPAADVDAAVKRKLKIILADIAVKLNDRLKKRRYALITRDDPSKIGLYDIHKKMDGEPIVGYFYAFGYLPKYGQGEEGIARSGFTLAVFLKVEQHIEQLKVESDSLLQSEHQAHVFEQRLLDLLSGALTNWNL